MANRTEANNNKCFSEASEGQQMVERKDVLVDSDSSHLRHCHVSAIIGAIILGTKFHPLSYFDNCRC